MTKKSTLNQNMIKTKPWIAYTSALIVAVIFILIALQNDGFARPFMNGTTTGRITQSNYQSFVGKYNTPRFSIEYTYQVNGQKYMGSNMIHESKSTNDSGNNLAGSPIKIFYINEDPSMHYVEGSYNSWVNSYVFAMIALLLILGVAFHLLKYTYFDELLVISGIIFIIISILWIISKISRIYNLVV